MSGDPMVLALALARRGSRRAAPNPMVGAVLVSSSGEIVGEGFHERAGGAHAETTALARAGEAARGGTLHVTLEPCGHHGRTPPCTESILASGVTRVVYGMRDPDPRVSGRSAALLEASGVAVERSSLAEECAELNRPYLTRVTSGRPFVIAKWAMSLDGRVATRAGESRWISSTSAREHAHRWRDRIDAIMVGAGTVIADDPELTCRGVDGGRDPVRVVLDGKLMLPVEARLVQTARQTPTWVITTELADFSRISKLEECGVQVLFAGAGPRVDLRGMLHQLARRDITNLMVEGGPDTLGTFVDAGVVDEAHVYVASRLLGGQDAPAAVSGEGVETPADGLTLGALQVERVGDDLFLHGRTPWSPPLD